MVDIFSFSFLSVVNCTDPGIPANSIRESKIEHGNFTFGSVVFYDCNPGYYLFGSSVLTCQPVGHWDKPLPECIGTVTWSLLYIYRIHSQILLLLSVSSVQFLVESLLQHWTKIKTEQEFQS